MSKRRVTVYECVCLSVRLFVRQPKEGLLPRRPRPFGGRPGRPHLGDALFLPAVIAASIIHRFLPAAFR